MGDVDPSGATAMSPGDGGGPVREAPPLVAGTQIDKYRLVRVIGSGGMGVVWAAHDPDLDREVALKVLRSEDAGQMLRTRLLREARAMARLKHPNVLTVYEVGTEYDRDYIAMELVEGGNLDTWLATKPAKREIWDAVLAAGRGLAAAHEAGLVHRDFKPHNVLRSETGRVMVTDFGLARGVGEHDAEAPPTVKDDKLESSPALDETVAAEPSTSSKSGSAKRKADPLLDSPMTQTGALIGTPAYMAPEQFGGGFAGARSDQFSFCVTAWQALSGDRPFKGDTMGELARAVLKGPGGVEADLPGAVREVLERGLDPDPTKRWPDMTQLLAALDRAGGQGRRRVTFAFALLGGLAIVGLGAAALRKPKVSAPPPPPPACPDAAVAIDAAWSPALRAAFVKTSTRGTLRAADHLDQFRAAWMTAYTRVCAAPQDARFHPRVGCLEGVRDQFAQLVPLFTQLPPGSFDRADVRDMLPQLSECASDHPVQPPELPADPAKRKAIHEARGELFKARAQPPAAGLEAIAALEPKVEQIAWKPLEAELYESAGVIAQLAGRPDLARRHLSRAARVAALARYYRLEVQARVALADSSIAQSGDPRNPDVLPLLFAEAEDAIASFGGSRSHSAVVDAMRGDAFAAQVRWDKAIPFTERAFATHVDLADARRAVFTGTRLASFYAARDEAGDLDKAKAILARAEGVAIAVGRDVDAELDEMAAEIAWRQHDLAEVHRRLARARPRTPETKLTWVGRVIDDQGAPVAGAHVVGWSGELAADAERLAIAPAGSVEATTDSTGGFTLVADSMAGIAAEQGSRRSPPLRVPAVPGKPLVITLGATRVITGKVGSKDDPLTGVTAEAHVTVGEVTLSFQAPVDRDGSFTLPNVPVGPVTLQATGAAGEGIRRTVRGGVVTGDVAPVLEWPVVQPVDVIVRGFGEVDIYVIAGKHAPKNRAQLVAAIAAAPTFALAAVTGVGADTTAAGRNLYVPDDVHAIVEGVAVTSTACAITAEPDAMPECTIVEPKIEKLTVRGGKHYASALAVVLEVGERIGVPAIIRDER